MLLEKSATLLWSTTSPTLHKCILTAFRSTSSTARKRRLEAFNAEREQQQQKYGVSIEKVIVSVQQEDQTERHLLMNDHLSTFHDCAKHISRLKVDNTALVHVTKESDASEYFASPHTTVDGKSKIKLLSFNTADYADHAYWRSCAFLLGALAETSLRADVSIIGALPSKGMSLYF
ncbi:unnamed protein product [Anisakis simplex]|uniref:39S ribosomal protein L39, mitochondrial (inferred by orthology to a human protein) n=1 Tax=Anisakis simplex TaxID=6269 RepID=A0A0M3IZQ7_ANISI|nr:unnamed protein product [Anisakis simplex]